MAMRNVVPAAVLVAIVAGCGAPQSGTAVGSSSPPTPGSTTVTVPSHSPGVVEGPAGTLAVVVKEPAGRADSAVRFLRVEDATGKSVLERSYRTTPAELSEYLPQGQYRVVSWIRACGGPCQGKEDKDLQAPAGICGTRLELVENAVASVTVDAPADGDCAMTTSR